MVSEVIKDLIKAEIENDPYGRGYAGKTSAEIAALLNSPFEVEIISKEFHVAPITRILEQVSNAPNKVEAIDVDAALES